jgi:hypothetical protein
MMISTRRRIFALSFALLAPAAAWAQDAGTTARPDAIQITQTGTHYVLTVPVSRLVMRLPKGNLVQANPGTGGGTSSPRYFYFKDREAPFIISGWFESQDGFTGVQRFWASEMAAWNKQLPSPQNVAFAKTGSWETITYDLTNPAVRGITNTNIRAHCVQAGTWIDLHFSLTHRQPDTAQARAQLAARLSAVSVSEKK